MENVMIPRPEHPRPDFVRDTFYNLNGTWAFAFDDADLGMDEGWFRPGYAFDKEITVPFCYQSAASGIGPMDEIHPVMWYRRSFTVPEDMKGRRVLVKFGAVDYKATVFVNGYAIGSHIGGYTPFEVDAPPYLTDGENDLCVRVEDQPDPVQPRGKQNWSRGLRGCWYIPTSGIWQTVYLEAVSDLRIDYVHVTPDIDRGLASVEILLNRIPDEEVTLSLDVQLDGKKIRKVTATTVNRNVSITVDMDIHENFFPVALWSPGHPALYDLRVQLLDGDTQLDRVDTYFGMRKIEVRDGIVYLNNDRLYQRLVLDQGYWPDTMITPPSDEAIRADLEWTKKFGFNGARKHQKIEDPRYYYWADKLGYITWGESASWGLNVNSDLAARNFIAEWTEIVERDRNHPSIITWTPFNETWGRPGNSEAARFHDRLLSDVYYLTKI